MPQVGFEPKIPVFQGAKTVHARDRVATMNDISSSSVEIKTVEIYLHSCRCASAVDKYDIGHVSLETNKVGLYVNVPSQNAG
jgi:hypothetical protein